MNGFVKCIYINQRRPCHRVLASVVGSVAFDACVTAGESDPVRIASVAGRALVPPIVVYGWMAGPAYSYIQCLERLYIVLAVVAQTAGNGLAY